MTFAVTAKDLKLGVLRKCGEPTDGTSIYDSNGDVVSLLNRAQMKVLAGGNEYMPELARPWSWALSPTKFILELQPPFNTGGVTMVSGSSAIVFDTPPTYSLQGWWFRITGLPEWFKIISHIGGSPDATIDCPYTDISGTSLAFDTIKLEYQINPTGGCLRVASPMVVYRQQDFEGDSEQKIYMTDEGPMLKDWTMAQIEQKTPTRFCVLTQDQFGNRFVRFNSFVGVTTKVEVTYMPYPTTLVCLPTDPFYCTATIANPAVFTAAGNDVSNGDPVVLSTTGALPTGLVAGTTYYVINQTTNTFQLSATVGGAAIATSGTQSGIITVTPMQPVDYGVVPNEHFEVLEFIAAHMLCVIKNDDRKQDYLQSAVAACKALMGAYQKERTEASKDRMKLIPRLDNFFAGRRYVSQEVTPNGDN